MNVYRFLIGAMAVCLAGCFSPRTIVFIDEPVHREAPKIIKSEAIGDVLRFAIEQTNSCVSIVGLEAKVICGDVYLIPVGISSKVSVGEISVDLSGKRFPRDWRSHIYWIENESITSPFRLFTRHIREIYRSKIQVPGQSR